MTITAWLPALLSAISLIALLFVLKKIYSADNDKIEKSVREEIRLSREEAVRGFTLDAAYAAFMEKSVGSLESGKRADFIVLDQNVFEIEPSEIANIKVLQTWLDGELVYSYP